MADIRWRDEWRWAWRHTPFFAWANNAVGAVLTNAIALTVLARMGRLEGFEEHLVVVAAATVASVILTPPIKFVGNLWRAPLRLRDDRISALEGDATLARGASGAALDATFEIVKADLPTGVLTVSNAGPQTARIQAYATWRGTRYDLVWKRTEVAETELLPSTQDVARVLYLVSNTARLAYRDSPSSGNQTIDLEFQLGMATDTDGYMTGEPLPEDVTLTITSDALTEPIVKRLRVTPTKVWEV